LAKPFFPAAAMRSGCFFIVLEFLYSNAEKFLWKFFIFQAEPAVTLPSDLASPNSGKV